MGKILLEERFMNTEHVIRILGGALLVGLVMGCVVIFMYRRGLLSSIFGKAGSNKTLTAFWTGACWVLSDDATHMFCRSIREPLDLTNDVEQAQKFASYPDLLQKAETLPYIVRHSVRVLQLAYIRLAPSDDDQRDMLYVIQVYNERDITRPTYVWTLSAKPTHDIAAARKFSEEEVKSYVKSHGYNRVIWL
jgi:hypothetical protein